MPAVEFSGELDGPEGDDLLEIPTEAEWDTTGIVWIAVSAAATVLLTEAQTS